MMYRIHVRPRMVATVLLAGLVFSLIVLATFRPPFDTIHRTDGSAADHRHYFSAEAAQAPHGFTAGWLNGQTVQFFYIKDFFCQPPPFSRAPSQCEVGEDGTVGAKATLAPSGGDRPARGPVTVT